MRLLRRLLVSSAWCAGTYLAYQAVAAHARRYDFRGRVVVITGGTRGLGLVMARQLAREGASLALCARDEEEVTEAVEELRQAGAHVLGHLCDLTDPDQIEAFFARVRREMGPVDVLINNAGLIQVGPLETMTHEDYEQAMAIHFWAPLRAIESVLPEMRARGQGRIVNIASIGGKVSVPHLVPYCASKFALVGLSQGLRGELAKEGILVTTICPGTMRTGSPRQALFKGQHREEFTWFTLGASIPVLSVSAERAANQILDACRFGRAQLTLTPAAKMAVVANAIAPELTSDVLSLTASLLPGPDGHGTQAVKGEDSTSPLAPSALTALTDKAAAENNELGGADRRPTT